MIEPKLATDFVAGHGRQISGKRASLAYRTPSLSDSTVYPRGEIVGAQVRTRVLSDCSYVGFGSRASALQRLRHDLGIGIESERRREGRLRGDRLTLRGHEVAARLRRLKLRAGQVRARGRAVANLRDHGLFVDFELPHELGVGDDGRIRLQNAVVGVGDVECERLRDCATAFRGRR